MSGLWSVNLLGSHFALLFVLLRHISLDYEVELRKCLIATWLATPDRTRCSGLALGSISREREGEGEGETEREKERETCTNLRLCLNVCVRLAKSVRSEPPQSKLPQPMGTSNGHFRLR